MRRPSVRGTLGLVVCPLSTVSEHPWFLPRCESARLAMRRPSVRGTLGLSLLRGEEKDEGGTQRPLLVLGADVQPAAGLGVAALTREAPEPPPRPGSPSLRPPRA
ncbi:hypothetical protein NDU88_000860 [Pleurodeles waltl]|uniref:Uncharacterized protein n=1 Tax=Pleurodeles waltl TaxID=8319 RepID=A0AAV7P2I6_PLEWA|nr:hypothetical protein NDU88_000860 [Pleurodeles waltl]